MKAGDRIECVCMQQEKDPVPPGTKGTVTFVSDVNLGGGDRFTQIGVDWDNGRKLMLCVPPDSCRVCE